MKKMICLAALAASMHAGAVGLTVVGGSDVAVPAINDVIESVGTYNIGGDLYLDNESNITFTYLGHEAAYSNDFNFDGSTLNNKTNSVDDSFTKNNVAAGLLAFDFYANDVSAGLANGSNQPVGSEQSFAILLDYEFKGTTYDAVLLWDDSGANIDDNHDDHVIGLTVQAVPIPAAAWLFGSGLIGLAGVARRRSSS